MANVIHAEAVGPLTGRPLVCLPPNSMDGRAWIYQTARFSGRYRVIAVDLPGCSRASRWAGPATPRDIALACWETVDRLHESPAPGVIVGCSVGSRIAQEMYHVRPAGVGAIALTGTGFSPTRDFTPLIEAYEENGAAHRYQHVLAGFSPGFRDTAVARWFADTQTDGHSTTYVETITEMMRGAARSTWEPVGVDAPVLIASGSADFMHESAYELQRRLPGSDLHVLPGVGHVAQVEAPDAFDTLLADFLTRTDLHP